MDIVLLRGLTRESRHWGEFPKYLHDAFPNAQISCLDVPGAGKRHEEEFPLSLDALLHDLHEKMHKTSIHEDRYLISISLGGMIALNWLKKYPQDFKKAAIINSSARNISPIYKRLNLKNFKALCKILKSDEALAREREILNIVCSNKTQQELEHIAHAYAEFFKDAPFNRKNTIRQLLLASVLSAPKNIERGKLCFFAGKKDKLVDFSCTEKLAEFYHAQILYNDNAGHDLPLDDPKWLADKLMHDFIG